MKVACFNRTCKFTPFRNFATSISDFFIFTGNNEGKDLHPLDC